MSLTRSIFRNSFFFFTLIPFLVVWGFWVTYFQRPPETLSIYDHVHGYAMFAWVAMLIAQSFLVRTNRRPLHRQLGKLAWALGPLIMISTLMLTNYRLNVRGLTDEGLYILSLQIYLLIPFAIFYTMAMRHRKTPDVHARWMICTALTLLDPIFARILLVNFIHVPLESGIVQVYTFSFVNLIAIMLIALDWRSHQRKDVFLPALILLLVGELGVFLALRTQAWHAFAAWFMKLPLS